MKKFLTTVVLPVAFFASACAQKNQYRGISTKQSQSAAAPSCAPMNAPNAISSRSNVACTLVTNGGTCNHIISDLSTTAGPSVVMTKKLNPPYSAGNRVCIKAGNYPYARLWIENVTGDEGNPVEFINCGGQVVIGNAIDANSDGKVDSSRGIEFKNARFIKVTGSGSPDHRYGIKLAGTQSGVPALSFSALSSDMEVEFLEITKAGFSGIMAKTDATCTDTNPLSFRGGFVQRNTVFHDNYIHDLTGGEGFYIGYSFGQGNTLTACPDVTVYSHPLVGTKVYGNRLENIACEAIQIGNGENSEVFNNYIRGYGQDPFASWQDNGIQIGLGTSGKFYNNYIASTAIDSDGGAAITILGHKDTFVYGNTMVGAGIYVNLRAGQDWSGTAGPYTLTIANNTIINNGVRPENRGIWSFNSVVTQRYINNLILLADPASGTLEQHATSNAIYDQTANATMISQGLTKPNITQSGNIKGLISRDQNTHFVAAASDDFRLRAESSAVDQGADLSALPVLNSWNNAMGLDHTLQEVLSCPRVHGSAVDIGAFEFF